MLSESVIMKVLVFVFQKKTPQEHKHYTYDLDRYIIFSNNLTAETKDPFKKNKLKVLMNYLIWFLLKTLKILAMPNY